MKATRFNKKTRPGPNFPPMNPGGRKKKTGRKKKY
jgi:hypothetical protein